MFTYGVITGETLCYLSTYSSYATCSHGQLGLGDQRSRLKPEMIRYLRGMRAKQVAAGGKHSAVLSASDVVLCFGSNSYGQLGLGTFELQPKLLPTVVERVSDMKTIEIACGSAHTLIMCLDWSGLPKKVFACG